MKRKKGYGRALLLAAAALALLLALGGCAQEKQEDIVQTDAQARETVLQFCSAIFGGADETGVYHIRVADALDGGRVDEYDCPRGVDEWGYAASVSDAMPEETVFTAAAEEDWTACQNGLAAEFSYGDKTIAIVPCWGEYSPDEGENWRYEFPCGDTLRLTDGAETVYLKNNDGWIAERLSAHMQGAEEKRIYDLRVDGAETDYETVANEFCTQFAANLNAAPRWFSRKPDDAAAQVKERVFDAYYGEEDPNFCFGFGAMLRFDEPESARRYGWEAGSGMIEPSGEGEYGDYYSWGVGADACKNEAGDWYIEGTWTGGGGVRLPYIGRGWDSGQQTATASQLAECWFLSAGESHEWRLPNMIYSRPSAELREMLAGLSAEQAAELEAGLRAVWDDPIYADMFPGGFDAKLAAD